MCEEECFYISGIVLAIVFLITGAPLWGVGAYTDKYATTESFISIPIFPETEGGLGKYGAVQYDGEMYYPNQTEYNITISTGKLYRYLKKDLKLYLFHNLWGINASLTVKYKNHQLASKTIQFNTNDENVKEDILNGTKSINNYASEFITNGVSFVYCPYSTLITIDKDIDTLCRNDSYPMKIEGKFATEYITDNNFEDYNILEFNFSNLEVLPKNFIEVPQIYIGGFVKSNRKALIISGIFFVMVSLILIVVTAVAFTILQI